MSYPAPVIIGWRPCPRCDTKGYGLVQPLECFDVCPTCEGEGRLPIHRVICYEGEQEK